MEKTIREMEEMLSSRLIPSINVAAKSMGISPAALSQFLAGKYAGNSEKINKACEQYLELVRERRLFDPFEGFVETNNAKRSLDLVKRIHLHQGIGVIVGRAGLGKTKALKYYANAYTDVIYVEADSGCSARELLKNLNRLAGSESKGSIAEIKDNLIERLKGTGRLVIIDQAEYLSERALDIVRGIHDKAGIGIVLAGLPKLLSNLRGNYGVNEQIYSRITAAIELFPIKSDDVEALVHLFLPGSNGAYKLFLNKAKGSARVLRILCKNTKILAGEGEITESIIAQAERLQLC